MKIDSEYRYMRTLLGIGAQRCRVRCGANIVEEPKDCDDEDTCSSVRTKAKNQHLKTQEEAASVMMKFQVKTLLQYRNIGKEIVMIDVAKTLI